MKYCADITAPKGRPKKGQKWDTVKGCQIQLPRISFNNLPISYQLEMATMSVNSVARKKPSKDLVSNTNVYFKIINVTIVSKKMYRFQSCRRESQSFKIDKIAKTVAINHRHYIVHRVNHSICQ